MTSVKNGEVPIDNSQGQQQKHTTNPKNLLNPVDKNNYPCKNHISDNNTLDNPINMDQKTIGKPSCYNTQTVPLPKAHWKTKHPYLYQTSPHHN